MNKQTVTDEELKLLGNIARTMEAILPEGSSFVCIVAMPTEGSSNLTKIRTATDIEDPMTVASLLFSSAQAAASVDKFSHAEFPKVD